MNIFEKLLGKGKKAEPTQSADVLLLERLKETIKPHEGLRLKLYKCPANKWSIGWGRNLEDNGISEKEAEILLTNDITNAKLQLFDAFPWAGKLDEDRKCVLIEMVFNMGIKSFKGFKKMLAACQKGEWDKAASEMLDSDWHRQVGKRAETLANIIKKGKQYD